MGFSQRLKKNVSKTKTTQKLAAKPRENAEKPLRQCKECSEQFGTVKSLRAHMRSLHSARSKIVCQHCSVSCRTRKNLLTHLKVSEAVSSGGPRVQTRGRGPVRLYVLSQTM